MNTTQESQAPSLERELLDRQTGIRTFEKFEQRVQEGPDAPSEKSEAEGTLTEAQQKAWNRAERSRQDEKQGKSESGEREARPEREREPESRRREEYQPEPPREQMSFEKLVEAPAESYGPSPQTYAEWSQAFDPQRFVSEWSEQNPDGSYEQAMFAMNDFQAAVRGRYQQAAAANESAVRETSAALKETARKYPGAEEKVSQAARRLWTEAPLYIQQFVNDSEQISDLVYHLSDAKTLDHVLETARSNPSKALRMLRDLESDLESGPPQRPKPSAPRPVSEVGGRGTSWDDPEESAIGRGGNFRELKQIWDRQAKVRAHA